MAKTKEQWDVAKGINEGNIMIVRRNIGIDSLKNRKYFYIRSGISFKLVHPRREDGLPEKSEIKGLNNTEDAIFTEIDTNAIVAVIITTSGFREYMIYHNESFKLAKFASDLQLRFPKYRFTQYSEKDKNWRGYNLWKD